MNAATQRQDQDRRQALKLSQAADAKNLARHAAKPTLGPWAWIPERNSVVSLPLSTTTEYRRVATVATNGDEGDVNGRLIAAVLDLHEYVTASALGGCATAQKLLRQIGGQE